VAPVPPIPTSKVPEEKKAVAESPVVAIQDTLLIQIFPLATSGRVKVLEAAGFTAVKVMSKASSVMVEPSNTKELPLSTLESDPVKADPLRTFPTAEISPAPAQLFSSCRQIVSEASPGSGKLKVAPVVRERTLKVPRSAPPPSSRILNWESALARTISKALAWFQSAVRLPSDRVRAAPSLPPSRWVG